MGKELGPNVFVALHSLQTPEYNGKRGRISIDQKEISSAGRWLVTLESGAQHNFKPENLKPVEEADLAKASAVAGFQTPLSAPKTRKIDKYYGTDPDGYAQIRKKAFNAGDIKACNFDHELYKAMSDSMNELGHITAYKWRSHIYDKVADGRGNRPELTCNERWTLRFGLGEFDWDFDARYNLILDLPEKLHVMSVETPPTQVKDPTEMMLLLRGPTLEKLDSGERPAKRAKTESGETPNDKLVWVDGMYLDKEMLIAARRAVADDNVIDAQEAIAIYNAVADDKKFTRCERWTLRFILAAYVFTDAAFKFLKEACFKLEQTDSLDA